MPTKTDSSSQDPVVYSLSKASRCYACDRKLESGELVKLEDLENEREVRCRQCCGLTDLLLVPPGNATLTRLVKKYATQKFVILKWSELWKTYEKQGLLANKEAVEKSKAEVAKPKEQKPSAKAKAAKQAPTSQSPNKQSASATPETPESESGP